MAENTVFVCVEAGPAPALSVTFPGIGVLQAIKTSIDGTPTPSAAAMLLLGQVSPALSPIVAVLRLVEVVTTILSSFKDVTNPFALAKDLEKLTSDIGLLGDFIPGVPYVRMIRDMLIMVEDLLRGIALKMQRWVTESQAISQSLQSAKLLNDTDLQASADCAANKLIAVQQGTQVSLQDVGQILAVIKLIADIVSAVIPVSLPGIGDIGDLLNTLATTLAAAPGAIGTALEDARVLQLATQMTSAADKIHILSVTLTQLVGT